MRTPRTTRLAPAPRARTGIAESNAAGMPSRSISLLIVAPQRLQLPQVAVCKTASTPASFSSRAISAPIRLAFATDVPFPTVTQ
jgi:hypothetical protein